MSSRRSPRSILRPVAGLAAAATLAGTIAMATVGAPAGAASVDSIDVANVKQHCLNAIDRRFTTLDQLGNAMTQAKNLTTDHRTALQGELGADRTGLTALRAQISGAGDARTLADLCPKIRDDYRVYMLEVPTVHLTIAADREGAAETKLDDVGTKLQAAIATAKAAGKDVSQVEALYADFQAKVADARAKSAGVPGAVIPLTPADVNDGTGIPVLISSRDALVQGRTDLLAARDDATKIVAALKAMA